MQVAKGCWQQVLVREIMTPQDSRAEGLVGPALQACLVQLAAALEADSAHQDLAAATQLLQHLIPSHKHLTMLHHYVQVRFGLSVSLKTPGGFILHHV